MKKTFLNLLLILVLTPFVHSQESTAIQYEMNVLKFNPAVFSQAQFSLSYERYFSNRKSSITINPAVTLLDNRSKSINGIQVVAQYRFYVSHLNKSNGRLLFNMENFGFYTGLYVLGQQYNEDFKRDYWDPVNQEGSLRDYRKEITAYEGGALLGIQIDITKRIVFDFNVGGGVRYTDYTNTYEADMGDYYEEYSVLDPEYQGVKPKGELLLGITF